MEDINSLRDEKTGRFKTTINSTDYKMVQFNNKRMSEHQRMLCIALNIPEIPKGIIVHHIDENKSNNDINNLALMTITAHNRIHSHEAWNKGVKTSENTIFKIRQAREKFYLVRFKEAYDLSMSGKSNKEIAEQLGVTNTTIRLRIKRYKELNNK